MIRTCFLAFCLSFVSACLGVHAQVPTPLRPSTPPNSVERLFEDFDPRRESLDIQVVREWEKEEIVYRYVTFHVGTFKNKPARLAAFYAFPKGALKRPALLHIHGGGQRAFIHEVEFYAKRGYPCLSINWGGREMENAEPRDQNTDWGAVDPTQKNVIGYFNLKPGDLFLDPFESPRNNNWYLLTLGARRALTFLEQQPEVNPDKLGVYGHSMGGSITVYVAGSDNRVKAASPSVGGAGFRTQPQPLMPQVQMETTNGDNNLFSATLGFESYAPRIQAPLLWLGSTNDFHGIMDDTYRTGSRIPHAKVRYSFTPHMNHRFTPEFAVTRPLWFDEHLRESFRFPKIPESQVDLLTPDHIPQFVVIVDPSLPVASVQLYYSVDPDPRARFWRTADSIQQDQTTWTAKLPILSTDQPMFAFANVTYECPRSTSEPYSRPTDRLAISSLLHTVTPESLTSNQVVATDQPDRLIEDFSHGWRDWYQLSPDNPHHWEFSTRKLTDPKWQGQDDQLLSIDVQTDQANRLIIVLTENFFRSYRGKQQEFVAVVPLDGGPQSQNILLAPDKFQTPEGTPLNSWKQLDILSFRAYYEQGDLLLGSKSWVGKQPVFERIQWRSRN